MGRIKRGVFFYSRDVCISLQHMWFWYYKINRIEKNRNVKKKKFRSANLQHCKITLNLENFSFLNHGHYLPLLDTCIFFFLLLCLMMRFIQYDKIFRNSILWITYKMSFNAYVNDFELVDLIGIRKNKSPKYRSHSGSLSIGPREWWGILWFNQKIDIFVLHHSCILELTLITDWKQIKNYKEGREDQEYTKKLMAWIT